MTTARPAVDPAAKGGMRALVDEIARLQRLRRELADVGIALSAGWDLDDLLDRIVRDARRIAVADAGSLYVLESKDREGREKALRFAVAQCDSKEIPFKAFVMPLDAPAAAAAAARTGTPLRFEDAYRIPPEAGVTFNRSFDDSIGYRTKSMLVIPMKDFRGDVVGVVQLLNKKRGGHVRIPTPADAEREVLPFTDEDVEVLSSLASQAGIAIERARLYLEIERLLRGFIEAAATAIEARDPTTSGHSNRIAGYMVVFAKRLSRAATGPFASVQFSPEEIRQIFYASMLHDVGKIGVPEAILTKANKLSDDRLAAVEWRLTAARALHPDRAEEVEAARALIRRANRPGFLPDADVAAIRTLGERTFRDADGRDVPLLEIVEVECLAVQKGNLTKDERAAMEYHVVQTRQILDRIPWTRDLARVPEIAGSHHEMLDGSGYPNRWRGERIPFEGKMMAICDIFEAMTACDRPYKPATPVPKTLAILEEEVKRGRLDADLFAFFRDERVYDAIPDEQRRRFTMTSDELLALE